jgi:transposase-like protein
MDNDIKDNLDALNRLRALPRGTQVDSRIAAIQALLGEKEVFNTLKALRWPQGVVCPRCGSRNIVRRDPPVNSNDKRHFYECLNCKGDGDPSDFDDFTGLPIGTLQTLRQTILCWYLLGFCSMGQIAKVLGLSLQEIMQMATIGNELAEKAEATMAHGMAGQKDEKDPAKKTSEHDEDLTRSASKSPYKPGYKSKR